MGGGGHQLPQEGAGLSSPKLTWLDGHGACYASSGGSHNAHLGVDLAPLAPSSGAALHLMLLILLLPTLLPTLNDRPTVLGS